MIGKFAGTLCRSVSNFYKTLGLNTNATPQQVKKAYITLAKKYHPDSPSGSSEKFKEIAHAYQVLSNQSSSESQQKNSRSDSKARREDRATYSSKHKHRSYENPENPNVNPYSSEKVSIFDYLLEMATYGMLSVLFVSSICFFYKAYTLITKDRREDDLVFASKDTEVRLPERQAKN